MNRDSFSNYIAHPASIRAADIPTLEVFVQQFPYCQLAHFFIAKPHFDLLTVQAEQQVQRAAVYAISRYKLKKFLEIPPTPAATGTPEAKSVSATITSSSAQPADKQEQPQAGTIDELLAQADLSAMPLTKYEKLTEVTLPASEAENIPVKDVEDFNEKIKKLKQTEIINNFIKTEPRISSGRVMKDAPVQDLSERSITAPPGLVSENLANIMLKQGKTDKAIEIYNKLMLKFPEKKTYFAEKIENLKYK